MCFGQPFTSPDVPSSPRGTNTNYRNAYCLAPYFTDLHPGYGGNVYYRMYDNALNDIDATIVDLAKQLVLDVYNVTIEPNVIVTATWVDISHYSFRSTTKVLPFDVFYLLCICNRFYKPEGTSFQTFIQSFFT